MDVNATSYYLENPVNIDWPKYRADADCWLNCNYFGGVWWASALCNIASTGTRADACKYDGRYYYGIQEIDPVSNKVYRYPVWFALHLLRERGGLEAGNQMLSAQIREGASPMLEAFATGGPTDLRVIVINKSSKPKSADLTITGLKPGKWLATQYLFDQTRVAAFMGRKPGFARDGVFQGWPNDDSLSAQVLEPVSTIACESRGGELVIGNMPYPAVSFTVLTFTNANLE
jgi:hypothetical protein